MARHLDSMGNAARAPLGASTALFVCSLLLACSGGPAGGPGDATAMGDSGGAGDPIRGDTFAGDSRTPGDTNSPYLPVTDYCETIAGFFCDFYLRCGRMNVPDAPTCNDVFLESCNGRYERRYRELETAGLLRLSRAGVAACRDHLAVVPCAEQIRELRGPCFDLFEGTQAAGDPCGYDVESFVCAPGTACVLDMSLCGTCEIALGTGADCSVADTTCSPSGVCRGDQCVDRKLIGEGCAPTDSCELGAWCDAATGTCRGPSFVGIGNPCDAGNRCPYLTGCSGGACVATARIGESCQSTTCETGSCDPTATCVALLPTGSACTAPDQCHSGRCTGNQCAGFPTACF